MVSPGCADICNAYRRPDHREMSTQPHGGGLPRLSTSVDITLIAGRFLITGGVTPENTRPAAVFSCRADPLPLCEYLSPYHEAETLRVSRRSPLDPDGLSDVDILLRAATIINP